MNSRIGYFTVFSADINNDPFRLNIFNNFLADVRREGHEFEPLIGVWKGQKEHAWLCHTPVFDEYIRNTPYVQGQECFMHVALKEPATFLEYSNQPGVFVYIGHMETCDKETAELGDYSYCPRTDMYWRVVRKGYTSSSIRKAVTYEC